MTFLRRSRQTPHSGISHHTLRRSLTIILAIGLCTLRVSAIEAAVDDQCAGGVYSDANTAKAQFVSDCGTPYRSTTSFRCDWVPGGWQCKGPGNTINSEDDDVVRNTGTTGTNLGNGQCAGGIYDNARTAKDQFGNDCGTTYTSSTAFRCDWARGGWQCRGPGRPTSQPIEPEPRNPVIGNNGQTGTDLGNGRCAGGIYDNDSTAKTQFENDCGTPYLSRSSFSCAWGAGGWQCQGPAGNVGSPSQNRPAAIVSIGDSYLSGESGRLIGNNSAERRPNAYDTGTNLAGVNLCHRSDVAPIHSAGIDNVTAFNIACSGATITDIIGSASNSTTGRFGERLQIDQLRNIAANYDVKMVVVSIGGNDIGFTELAAACAARYAIGSRCEREGAIISSRIENIVESRIRKTIEEIRRVLRNAGQSDARIVLQSYPSPVPASTDYEATQRLAHGCTFNESDMRFINKSFVPDMDSAYRKLATDLNIDFLSLVDTFDGKEVCSPYVTSRNTTGYRAELEWATGIRLKSDAIDQESLHPNALGQKALGRCLELVWNSNESSNTCHNNGGEPSDMRLGGKSLHSGVTTGTLPICQSATSDNNNDGMGWENGRNCYTGIAPNDVDCKNMKATEARICGLVLERINAEIGIGRLSLDNNGILFNYVDNSRFKINSSSCSNRVYVKKQQASARIGSNIQLNLKGNSITTPLVLRLEIPFNLSVRIDGETKLGYRFFGSCNKAGSDSYNARATLSGTADLLIVLDLGATFGVNRNGDLTVTVKPKVVVGTDLRNPDLRFDMHGVNPVAQFVGFTSGFVSGFTDGVAAAFAGKSVTGAVEDRALDLGVPIGLTTASLVTSSVIGDMLDSAAEREAQRQAEGFSLQIEKDLNAELKTALGLNAFGIKTFVIDKNFATRLNSTVKLDDLLVSAR